MNRPKIILVRKDRHAFATRCVKLASPVNSTLIGKWMGHKGGGRTVMLGYGHLRTEHSQKEAATMKFL